MESSFRHHGLSPPVPVVENDSLQHALRLALALDAVVIAAQSVLRHEAPQLPINSRPFPTPLADHFDIGIVTKSKGYLSPAAVGLIEDVKRTFRRDRT